MNKSGSDMGKTVPMRAESVNFTDGMIVTAADLSTAMAYPLALMQSVNRAVFGCGVVCGFELNPEPDLCCETKPCDRCNGDDQTMAYPSFTIEIGHGTAIDCSGLPVELCESVLFDLGDEQCGCDTREGKVCILIRRMSSTEAPRGDCCGSTSERVQCSRVQDHLQIRAFPIGELPEHTCMHPFEESNDNDCVTTDAEVEGSGGANGEPFPKYGEMCECLSTCRDLDCCGEGWILLGCLELCKGGIVVESFKKAYRNRKWIKTVECFCPELGETLGTTPCDSIENLRTDVARTVVTSEYNQNFAVELGEAIQNPQRAHVVVLAGANDFQQALDLLEKRQDEFKQAWGLTTTEVLDDYKTMIKKKIDP